jgi:hypothetical protein
MSWGERSCVRPCRCPEKCTYETCNVDCLGYAWNGVTKPDSVRKTEPVTVKQTLNRAQRRALKIK